MTEQEINKAVEQLKAEGHSEEEILGAFYKMFQDDKLTLDEFEGIVNLMGYHLTDEFKAMSPEDQKTKGYEETNEEDQGEENKEPEGLPEGKEMSDDGKEVVSEKEESGEKEDQDESDEEKKAMKLFGQK